MGQVTVFGRHERRRRWSDGERVQIVAEAFAPGAFVAQVARRHDISTGLICTWRRKRRRRSDAPTGVAGSAKAVIVDDFPVDVPTAQPTVVVDSARGGRVSVFASASPDQVAAVFKSMIR